MVAIGNFIGQIGDLRFQAWLLPCQKPLANFTQFARVLGRTMLQNTFPRFKRQIQSVERRIALFQYVDDAQRLQVVLETAVRLHAFVSAS